MIDTDGGNPETITRKHPVPRFLGGRNPLGAAIQPSSQGCWGAWALVRAGHPDQASCLTERGRCSSFLARNEEALDDYNRAVRYVTTVAPRVTGRIAARRGFHLAETLVQYGFAGGNGTYGGTLHQPVLGVLVG